MNDKSLEKLPRRRLSKINQKERVSIINSIEKYYCDQEYPFTINDVREHLKKYLRYWLFISTYSRNY